MQSLAIFCRVSRSYRLVAQTLLYRSISVFFGQGPRVSRRSEKLLALLDSEVGSLYLPLVRAFGWSVEVRLTLYAIAESLI